MDPSACLERIREAYGCNDYAEIQAGCVDLLAWLRKAGAVPITTESQLSALLIMSIAYGKREQVEHAP